MSEALTHVSDAPCSEKVSDLMAHINPTYGRLWIFLLQTQLQVVAIASHLLCLCFLSFHFSAKATSSITLAVSVLYSVFTSYKLLISRSGFSKNEHREHTILSDSSLSPE